mgnify:CR=1 FL=1
MPAFIALTACSAGPEKTNEIIIWKMKKRTLVKTGNHHGEYHSGPV